MTTWNADGAGATCDILVTNGYVITMDPARTVHPAGAVAVTGARIVAVGLESALASRFRPKRVIDAGGGVIHPGMIDTHLHAANHLTRTGFPDDPKINAFEKFAGWINELTDEDEFANALVACTEMVRNGFTCAMEPGTIHEPDTLAAATEAVGSRISLSDPFVWDTLEGGNPLAQHIKRAAPDARRARDVLGRELRRNRVADGLVHAHVCIYGSGSASQELELEAKRVADANGVILNQHQNFSPTQVALDDRRFGGGPVLVRFAELGLLGPNSTFTHMNVIRDEEVEPIVASGMSITWQPGNYQYYGLAQTQKSRMAGLLDRGVNVTLGVDVAKIWTFGDMARIAYLVARQSGGYISCERLMEMSTIGAARALGLQREIGSLEPGKRADIVVRSPEPVETLPGFNPVVQLMMLSQSRAVDTVLCNGEIVLRGGRLTRLDERWVNRMARACIERMAARLDLKVGTLWEAGA